MSERRKILFVINTMGRAGAEKALVELLRTLEPEKYQVDLYALIPRGEMFREVPAWVTVLNPWVSRGSVHSWTGSIFIGFWVAWGALGRGCLIRAAKGWLERRKTPNPISLEKMLRRLQADCAPALQDHYDLAVAYLEGQATWFVAEKVQAERKVAFVHIDYTRAGYTREMDQECYGQYHAIFAVSRDVQERFLEVYPQYRDRTEVFLNLIDQDRIRQRAQEPGGFPQEDKGFKILTVGRLYHQKGYDIAIETAALLNQWGYKFRWYVLGEGEERKSLQALIRKHKLENVFILLGAKENPYPYFKQADLYVCTSRYEGKSIVIEEAQTLGKAIVAANCTGIEEQIQDGVEGMILPGEPQALAGGIQTLMEQDDLREQMGKAAEKKEYFHGKGYEQFMDLAQGEVLWDH